MKKRAYILSDTYETESELPVIVTYSIIDGEIEIEGVEIDQSKIDQDDLQDWYASDILYDLKQEEDERKARQGAKEPNK